MALTLSLFLSIPLVTAAAPIVLGTLTATPNPLAAGLPVPPNMLWLATVLVLVGLLRCRLTKHR